MNPVFKKGASSIITEIKNVNSPLAHASEQQVEINNLLADAYAALWEDDLELAGSIITHARVQDEMNPEVKFVEILLERWRITLHEELPKIQSPEEQGNLIISKCQSLRDDFKIHNKDSQQISSKSRDAIQHFLASIAKKKYYEEMRQNPSKRNNLAFRIKLMHTYKLCFEYERAIKILSASLGQADPAHHSYIYAHIADCFSESENQVQAKVFFKHAFFIDPSSIPCYELQSPMIHDILHIIQREHRYPPQYFNEWIPIYGYITRYFDIKHKLSPIETENTKQEINSYEIKLNDVRLLGKDDSAVLIPRLLSKFFLLLDHYSLSEKLHHKQDEIANKIREYDSYIFSLYEENHNKHS